MAAVNLKAKITINKAHIYIYLKIDISIVKSKKMPFCYFVGDEVKG